MNVFTGINTALKATCLLTGTAICLLLATYPDTADARGGGARGGGVNISRNGPASSGSFNTQPAVLPAQPDRSIQRSGQTDRAVRTDTNRATDRVTVVTGRNYDGAAAPDRDRGDRLPQRNDDGVLPDRGDGSIGEDRPDRDENILPDRPAQLPADDPNMQEIRRQFIAQNKDRWDDYIYDDYGVRYDDVDGGTVYVVQIPCTVTAVIAASNTTYYRCEAEAVWYKRAYRSSDVVYLESAPPEGY